MKAFIVIPLLAGVISASPSAVRAGDAGNILACIEAVEAYSARKVDEFDVRYTGRILGFSTAEWKGIQCEVSFEQVFNLTVDGQLYVVEGFAGREARSAFSQLEVDTDEAVSLLESRIQLLKNRLEEAEMKLQQPSPDIAAVSDYIHSGIARATGG
ncbi:hypothetical protein [Celeribacter neptunius]|nr:hypothetical protein [Celeribacter neptunius]